MANTEAKHTQREAATQRFYEWLTGTDERGACWKEQAQRIVQWAVDRWQDGDGELSVTESARSRLAAELEISFGTSANKNLDGMVIGGERCVAEQVDWAQLAVEILENTVWS